MADKSNDKKEFGSDDIRRYLSGEMSDSERYALEKAALEDPFLADAMEGMESRLPISELSQDLSSLETRLEKRIELKPKAIVAPFYKVAAAAIVFLLAGSLSILYFLNQGKEAGPDTIVSDVSNEAASNRNADSAVAFSRVPQVASDSSMQLSPSDGMKDVKSRAIAPGSPALSAESSAPQAFLKSRAPGQLSETNLMKTDDAEVSALQKDESRRESRSGIRRTRDSLLVAEENTSLISAKTDTLTRTGVASERSTASASPALRSMDTAAQPVGYATSRRPAPLEEVIVGKAAGVEVNTKRISRSSNSFSIEPLSSDTTAFGPVSSWSNYANRINSGETLENRKSETILQFRINAQGQPQDLRILKTENSSRSAEIIRSIQNGPLWKIKPGVDSTVKVLIRF